MVIYEEIYNKNGLSKTQQKILKLIDKNKKVLEIGCSSGYMTKIFLKNNCIVDVVEIDKKALAKIPKGARKVLNKSIENNEILNLLSNDYDFIVLADVLEHLVNPENALKILYKVATRKSRLLISLPNIASWVMRKQLFFKGDFGYKESGLLDKTHLHFYTVKTLPKLLLENNWQVENITGTILRLPYEGLINKIPILGFIFKKVLYNKIAQRFPNLSYYHFLVTAFKK